MKILQLCNRIPWPARDGGAIAMLQFIRSFHELGHSLHLLCLNTQKHYIEADKLPPLFKKLAHFEAVDINTAVTPLGALKGLIKNESYNISRFFSKDFDRKLAELLQRETFDIIHVESLHMSPYLPTIRKHSKAKVVMRSHNVEYLIWQRLAQAEKPGIKKWYVNKLARQMKNYEVQHLNKYDAIVPITAHDKQFFIDLGCTVPQHVAPVGINIENYPYQPSSMEWPSLFHIGALDWMPNLQAVDWFLEKVWPVIHRKFPEVRFYLAGRHMPQHIKDLKIAGVVVIGEVESAAQFMNSKALMVVPLQSGSGMRVKIIEGMALGKTIVSTAIGAEGIDVTDGQEIFIADTPETFAEKIIYAIENKSKFLEVGRKARKLVEEKYNNKRIAEELIGFYVRIL